MASFRRYTDVGPSTGAPFNSCTASGASGARTPGTVALSAVTCTSSARCSAVRYCSMRTAAAADPQLARSGARRGIRASTRDAAATRELEGWSACRHGTTRTASLWQNAPTSSEASASLSGCRHSGRLDVSAGCGIERSRRSSSGLRSPSALGPSNSAAAERFQAHVQTFLYACARSGQLLPDMLMTASRKKTLCKLLERLGARR